MSLKEIIRENLASLFEKSSETEEKVLYEISEFSRLIFTKIGETVTLSEPGELLRVKEVISLRGAYENADIPKEYLPLLQSGSERMRSLRMAAFAVFFSECVYEKWGDVLPWHEKQNDKPRVTYVKADAAEASFFALSERRKETLLLYADHFRDAVAAVMAEKADYALLPYISQRGERLTSVADLALQYDLFCCARIDVLQEEKTLSYALFATEAAPFTETDAMCLDFRITAESYEHLGEMLSVLSSFGYRAEKVFLVPEEYGRTCAVLTLLGNGNPVALWIYFSLYSAGFSFLGRYPHIKIKERSF